MNNDFHTSLQILKNTPSVLNSLLSNLDEEIINKDEGEKTWSPMIIVAHLISNEYSNFYSRIMLIVNSDRQLLLNPFDMDAQNKILQGNPVVIQH